jgi:hypothetical protein
VTRPDDTASGSDRQAAGWLACLPELAAAGLLALSTTVAAYAYAGSGTAVAVAAGWAVVSVVLLPTLIPAGGQPLVEQAQWRAQSRSSFLGFWRKRGALHDATASMVSFDAELRPQLQHLLAARLAERHGVSLYSDPAAARRLLLTGSRDGALWFWLDPERPAETDQRRPGPPPRTLSAILDRLERL